MKSPERKQRETSPQCRDLLDIQLFTAIIDFLAQNVHSG